MHVIVHACACESACVFVCVFFGIHLQVMKIQEVVKEVVDPWAIHRSHVWVLVAPSKGLLTDHRVHRIQFRNIGIVDKLTIPNKTTKNQYGHNR